MTITSSWINHFVLSVQISLEVAHYLGRIEKRDHSTYQLLYYRASLNPRIRIFSEYDLSHSRGLLPGQDRFQGTIQVSNANLTTYIPQKSRKLSAVIKPCSELEDSFKDDVVSFSTDRRTTNFSPCNQKYMSRSIYTLRDALFTKRMNCGKGAIRKSTGINLPRPNR